MEQNNPAIFENTGLDETAKAHLLETTRWTKFLAIIGFISTALLLIFAIIMLGTNPYASSYSSGLGLGMATYYVIIAAIYVYPAICLLKFSKLIKNGIHAGNQDMINDGLRYQKNMYRFLGILTIVVLVLILLVFVFAGVAGIMNNG